VLVQKMVGGGKETIVGMHQDPQFGPLLMFGLGGIYVEALGDVTFRVHPSPTWTRTRWCAPSAASGSWRGFAASGDRPGRRGGGHPADLAAGGRPPGDPGAGHQPVAGVPEGGVAVDGRITVSLEPDPV
jgi:hypothetical protein